MDEITLHPTVTAQWHTLINEAIAHAGIPLNEDLESYLVFLLMRFVSERQLADSVLALDYLQGSQQLGAKRHQDLRNVGDKCLLFSGLFPGCAARKRVRISYFVQLGQGAYGHLSNLHENQLGNLYCSLSEGFVGLMDVLHATREIDGKNETDLLTPLQAIELWHDTGSASARNALSKYADGLPYCYLADSDTH